MILLFTILRVVFMLFNYKTKMLFKFIDFYAGSIVLNFVLIQLLMHKKILQILNNQRNIQYKTLGTFGIEIYFTTS